jgi:thiamine pyrophosphokinase
MQNIFDGSKDRPVTFVRRGDQDKTDLEKALIFLTQELSKVSEQAAQKTHVCITGTLGGDTGHLLSNLGILAQYAQAFGSLRMLSPLKDENGQGRSSPLSGLESIQAFKDGTFTLQGTKKDHISVIGAPQATVRLSGVEWPIDNQILQWPPNNSYRNSFAQDEVSLEVRGTVVVVRPLHLGLNGEIPLPN